MIKLKLISLAILTLGILQACSKILEPVFLDARLNDNNEELQEEFNIKIIPLTFKNAISANKYPYQRKLMLTGSGARANLFDETDIISKQVPKQFVYNDYVLGYYDSLNFSLKKEYINKNLEWPEKSNPLEYVLGVGDKLSFILYRNNPEALINTSNDNVMQTESVIGSDGNILLLEVGSLKAVNRKLTELQAEVRNILIRNGITPNFQLEITEFQSKKAFLSYNFNNSTEDLFEAIVINNIPVRLKEVAISAGVTERHKDTALITLIRDKKEFSLTARQLFDHAAEEIYIQNNDHVAIKAFTDELLISQVTVGSRGNIILPVVGKIHVFNRTLPDVQKELRTRLVELGMKPEFQIEMNVSKNGKVYLLSDKIKSNVVPLTNIKLSLKELLLNYGIESQTYDVLKLVVFKRGKQTYRFPLDTILNAGSPDIWLQDNDQVEVENVKYKEGQVYALSGAGKASILKISPSMRETLSDVLFSEDGIFKNLSAKRSEVYLLRGINPTKAYHLDVQNVSRILVASKTELRPNDIIYVADRPIISFARTLAEISPLRALLRDLDNGNIP